MEKQLQLVLIDPPDTWEEISPEMIIYSGNSDISCDITPPPLPWELGHKKNDVDKPN